MPIDAIYVVTGSIYTEEADVNQENISQTITTKNASTVDKAAQIYTFHTQF